MLAPLSWSVPAPSTLSVLLATFCSSFNVNLRLHLPWEASLQIQWLTLARHAFVPDGVQNIGDSAGLTQSSKKVWFQAFTEMCCRGYGYCFECQFSKSHKSPRNVFAWESDWTRSVCLGREQGHSSGDIVGSACSEANRLTVVLSEWEWAGARHFKRTLEFSSVCQLMSS